MMGRQLRMKRAMATVARHSLALGMLLVGTSYASCHDATLIVVAGAEGAEEYREVFRESARRWQQAAELGGATCYLIGLDQESEKTDRDRLRDQLQQAISTGDATDPPIWVVLIGHGTFYRDTAKFNARGPDFSAAELAGWLNESARPIVVINGTSSSGPFINRLSKDGRVVVTATKSGSEQNYARFGEFISESITDSTADLDHDDEVSVLEAFLHAADRTAKFYAAEARLATEHALIDDNGDARGTPGDFFRGVRAVKLAAEGASVDGDVARRMILVPASDKPTLSEEQRSELARWEAELEALRRQQATMAETDYLNQLEAVLLPLAQLQNADSESD